MMSDPRIVGYLPPSGSSERTKILRLKVRCIDPDAKSQDRCFCSLDLNMYVPFFIFSLFNSFALSHSHLSLLHSFTISNFHSFLLSLSHPFLLSLFHPFLLSLSHTFIFTQVISADNLAKKDIFGASDPYVRIDLVTVRGDEVFLIDWLVGLVD